ncbi:chymotrypsin-2-like [Belonocnema kinseyi]|uniref:chymotrypsin-2-like n=1 Tax=Belonocnema kinseyi TaxID=2817044 RepID=UPI00143DD62B|nr:chymotrypsin-2-like [Belonocnema kinseyi]
MTSMDHIAFDSVFHVEIGYIKRGNFDKLKVGQREYNMTFISSFLLVCLLTTALGSPSFQVPEVFPQKESWNNEISGRIVGGSDADEAAFPYQVSLQINGNHFCGGSIIHQKWIMTAGHCLSGAQASKITVVVGTNDLTRGGTRYEAKRLVVHPNFSMAKITGDVALIELASAVTFSKSVSSIALPTSDITKAHTHVVVSGWGKKSVFGGVSPKLQYLNVKTVYQRFCSFLSNLVTEKNICTISKFGKGMCNGDSGSPVVAHGVQFGIVSWGLPCALGVPDVHTRVYSYVDWINGYVNAQEES